MTWCVSAIASPGELSLPVVATPAPVEHQQQKSDACECAWSYRCAEHLQSTPDERRRRKIVALTIRRTGCITSQFAMLADMVVNPANGRAAPFAPVRSRRRLSSLSPSGKYRRYVSSFGVGDQIVGWRRTATCDMPFGDNDATAFPALVREPRTARFGLRRVGLLQSVVVARVTPLSLTTIIGLRLTSRRYRLVIARHC